MRNDFESVALSLSYSIIVDIFEVDPNLIQYENAE